MLHQCQNCNTVYLVSHYRGLCNYCGSEIQQRIEKLSESDGSVEWWRICARANYGDYDGYSGKHRAAGNVAVAALVPVQRDPHAR